MSERYRNFMQLYDYGIPLHDQVDETNPPTHESESEYLAASALPDTKSAVEV